MNTDIHRSGRRSLIAACVGLASAVGLVGPAAASSDYKIIAQHEIAVGTWEGHEPWTLVRFHLPRNFDEAARTVLQMNVRSTNKSRYSTVYLNPGNVDWFEGCDSSHHDRYREYRVDDLPYAPHKQWRAFHTTVDGSMMRPGDNYLLICSRNKHGEVDHAVDNFYVKNIVVHYREFAPAPQFCPTVFEPVCGINGATYNNDCEAAKARVEIQHEGNCED